MSYSPIAIKRRSSWELLLLFILLEAQLSYLPIALSEPEALLSMADKRAADCRQMNSLAERDVVIAHHFAHKVGILQLQQQFLIQSPLENQRYLYVYTSLILYINSYYKEKYMNVRPTYTLYCLFFLLIFSHVLHYFQHTMNKEFFYGYN